MDQIRFFCTAPDANGHPWLQLPRVYALDDPAEYFTTDIKKRHERLLTRSAWSTAFRLTPPPPAKAGENEETPRPAGNDGINGKDNDKEGPKKSGGHAPRPTLLGMQLDRKEWMP